MRGFCRRRPAFRDDTGGSRTGAGVDQGFLPAESPARLSALGWFALIVVGLCLIGAPARLFAADPALPSAGAEVAIAVYKDEHRRLGLDDVRQMAARGAFRPLAGTVLNEGFGDAAYWLRFSVPRGHRPLVLEIDRPYLQTLDWFAPGEGGAYSVRRAGTLRPAGEREIDYRHPAFRLSAAADRDQDYFLRVESRGSLIVPLRWWDEPAFEVAIARENFSFGLYFGAVAMMALYNLFLFVGVRDRAYLWYVVYVAALGAFLFAHLGLAAQWWWPESPRLSTVFVYPCMALVMAAFMQYVRHLFGTPQAAPRLDRALRAMIWFAVLAVPPLVVGATRWSIYTMYAHIVGAIAVACTAGIVFWRKQFRPARYFMLAFAVLWIAGLAAIARAVGLTEGLGFLASHGVLIGSAAEVLLFAFALADRINLLKKEKENAQAEAMRNQQAALDASRQSEQLLEKRVVERTADLALARDEAQRANRAKTGFLAAASHDLRQPMQALGLLVAALHGRALDPAAARLARNIDAAVVALDGLLGELLDISKIDAGAVVPDKSEFALQPVLEGLRLHFEPLAAEKKLVLVVRSSALRVNTDAHLLDRILRNLVANAVRYTTKGKVLVACRRRGDRVRIEVCDSGPGIPRDKHEEIFHEFVRLRAPGEKNQAGMGLGLSIVRRLSDLLGHEIELRSVPGRGSCFAVSVPIAAASAGARESPAGQVAGAVGTPLLSGRLVLVIEDDGAVLEGIRVTLEAAGCTVVAAESLASALGELTRAPDAVVSDFHLAEAINGLDAIAELRRLHGERVPAVLISGGASKEEVLTIEASGVPLLLKPVRPRRLIDAIVAVLEADASGAD